MKARQKTESQVLFETVERVGELERENTMLRDRLDRHDKLFAKLGELVKIDLALAEMEAGKGRTSAFVPLPGQEH